MLSAIFVGQELKRDIGASTCATERFEGQYRDAGSSDIPSFSTLSLFFIEVSISWCEDFDLVLPPDIPTYIDACDFSIFIGVFW